MKRLFKREEGQTLGEFALIVLLIVLVTIVALTLFGANLLVLWNQIANMI
jgi:Flp pilus assembly pilin Flp